VATSSPKGRLFFLNTLSEKGINYSNVHLRRLWRAGKFPQPIYLSERRPAWTEAALDDWLDQLEADRARESSPSGQPE
jgi:prophage regulatory protein